MIPSLQDPYLPNPFAADTEPERSPLEDMVPAIVHSIALAQIASLQAEVAKLTAELRDARSCAEPAFIGSFKDAMKGPPSTFETRIMRDRALSSLSHDFPQLLRSCFEEDLRRHEIRLCVQTTDGRCHYTIVEPGLTRMYEAAADEMSGFLQKQGYVSKRAQQKLAIFNLSPTMPPTAPAAPHLINKSDVCQEAIGGKQTWPPAQPATVKWPF